MKKSAVFLLLLAFGCQNVSRQPVPTQAVGVSPPAAAASPAALQRIDQLLQEYTAANKAPGVLALVMRDGKVIYDKAFGVDDMATKTPLRTDAIMRIASQTKALTSTGVMLLYEQGKFQLDDPVSKYLPAFRNAKVLASFNPADSSYTTVPARSEPTIRQLLTHTSGLGYAGIGSKEARAIYAKARVPSGVGTPGYRLADAINRLGPLPLMHQPGERFTYGLSTDVLGRLIEVLSGQPLDAYLRTRIFEPLGMQDTYFYLPTAKQPRLATLYTEDAARNTVKTPVTATFNPNYPNTAGTYLSGGAGLSSTIRDYAVFLQMLLNEGQHNGKRLLQTATVRLMLSNNIGDLEQGGNKFGLGFSIVTPKGAERYGQSVGTFEWGGIFGTTYWVDPKTRTVALLYTQKMPNSYGDLGNKFKQLVSEAVQTPEPAPK